METHNSSWLAQYGTFSNCCDSDLAYSPVEYNWDDYDTYDYNFSGYLNTSIVFYPNFSFLHIAKYFPDKHVWEFKVGEALRIYSVSLITLFGLVGNSLTIVVYSLKSMKNSNVSLFLRSLAIVDTLTLLIRAPNALYLGMFQKSLDDLNWVFCKFYSFLTYVFMQSSGWILSMFALDRAISIHLPY